MDDCVGPHHRPPSLSPPPPDAGKRRRVPNVRLAGSIPLPSHLPHPRKVPIVPATRSRKPQHHNGGSYSPASEPPQALPKPWSPASTDNGDDLVLAAAFPRKSRVAEAESQGDDAGEVVDVAEWLWGMGMGRYVPAFEAHEVDAEVLPCLTMDDLRDMGIGAVGARRKLFCAIQRLPPPRR
ncbi:hypothetical protein PR202_ga12454 [Eleusine coracana subsp. coracana]|uniref:SAM domain-containing protein n=1 Tax=Eleusine coracana subsp. coracana TaxID=191504 RepID=A0AAV5CC77_ELECO|nr:hypothetical protein PR202_ga12454 [Eleusine coracana subsp. coracana]